MDNQRLHVGLIYGGPSPEHDVSIASARNVFGAFDTDQYRVTPIWIDLEGRWHVEDTTAAVFHNPNVAPTSSGGRPLLSPADDDIKILSGQWNPENGMAQLKSLSLDVAFPMLHGKNGEDGRIQGLFQTLDLPYVGASVLSSAACMDKEVTKRLLRDSGHPIVPFRTLRTSDHFSFENATDHLGKTLFIKPASSGSSIGTSKVENEEEYAQAVAKAFSYDSKVLVETAIAGREIECSVIGNEEPRTAVPGEIVLTSDFYTYEAKYTDPNAAHMEVPADISNSVSNRVRSLAGDAYSTLGCEGMARVDFFLTPEQDLLINEINTIPGFTERSMFPVMWENTGLPLDDLINTLIQLALDRHQQDAHSKTTI
jgi:D-alanine-D-alanine ligase